MYILESNILISPNTAAYNNNSNQPYKLRFDLSNNLILSSDTVADLFFSRRWKKCCNRFC